jgi:tetratricopeptide (TPR) repeat protein
MSRFGNLEFGGEPQELAAESSAPKDEAFYLASALESFGSADFEKALRYYAKALEYNPQNPACYTGQVRALIELGEFHEAAKWANKALEQFAHDPELLAAKAVAVAREGDLDAALAFSDAAVEERGNTPYVWLARADVLLARKEVRADYCFEKALALAPGNWFIAWLAARIRFYYKQFLAAARLLEQAIQSQADLFILWLDLGRCQLALGLAGRAEVSFRRALELNPGCTEARLGLDRAGSPGLVARLAGAWRSLFP